MEAQKKSNLSETGDLVKDMDAYRRHHNLDKVFAELLQFSVQTKPRDPVKAFIEKIGFLGSGVMAEAIIRGLIAKNVVTPADVTASDINEARRALMQSIGCNATPDGNEVVKQSQVIILATKPDGVGKALTDAKSMITKEKLIISICAGVTIAQLESYLSEGSRVVRVMPNTPCTVNAAATGFALGSSCTPDDQGTVEQIFNAVGISKPVPEYLLDGGVRNGLPRDTARALAAQLVYGSAKYVLESGGTHPAELRNRVESPGGTTIAGTHALESGGFRAAVIDAVCAATARSKELGQKK